MTNWARIGRTEAAARLLPGTAVAAGRALQGPRPTSSLGARASATFSSHSLAAGATVLAPTADRPAAWTTTGRRPRTKAMTSRPTYSSRLKRLGGARAAR